MKLDSTHTTYKRADAACSRSQLVLLLFDAAIRYTREAADHMKNGRWAEKGKAVEAAFECLSELRAGLDLKQGGEVAANLDRMYDFLTTKLTVGNASKDVKQFMEVVDALVSLRNSWQELFDRLKAEGRLAAEEG